VKRTFIITFHSTWVHITNAIYILAILPFLLATALFLSIVMAFFKVDLVNQHQNVTILDFIEATYGGGDNTSSSQIITTNKPTPNFLQARCTSCYATNSVIALKKKNFWRHVGCNKNFCQLLCWSNL